MQNNFFSAVSQNGRVVVYGVDSTEIVRRAEQIHKTSAVCTAALGRVLTAAAIMQHNLKNEKHSITLRVNGGGPAGLIVAIAQGNASVRGYVENPRVDLPSRSDGKLDVGGAVGVNGQLSVVKDLGLREPYCGVVPLVSGEIAEDITSYYATSEQFPTVCALGVLVNPDLTVSCAGGFVLQLLPGYTEEDIHAVEKNITGLPSITSMMQDGNSIQSIMEKVMNGLNLEWLEESTVEYKCNCSDARTRNMLKSLKQEELARMIEEDPKIEVVCEFCGNVYHYDLRNI